MNFKGKHFRALTFVYFLKIIMSEMSSDITSSSVPVFMNMF